MIEIDGIKLELQKMGLFTSKEKWIHPPVKTKTFEIIYVTEGEVFIEENKEKFHIKKDECIILKADTLHEGYKASPENTSFYWIHFYVSGKYNFSGKKSVQPFLNGSVIKELLHYSYTPMTAQFVKDSILAHILGIIYEEGIRVSNTAAHNVYEWTRINSDANLTVKKIAEHFGYNGEYVSRLIKKQYGITLKALIDSFILNKAKNNLMNTALSIKEISNLLNFSSPNAFIKFYKYHEKISPSKYRNMHFNTHMNKK